MRAYKTLHLLSFCLPFLAALFSTEALAQSSNSVTLTTRREIGHELGLRLKGDRETFSFEGLDDVWEDEVRKPLPSRANLKVLTAPSAT